MTLRGAVSFMAVFTAVCAVALAAVLVANAIPEPEPEPACEHVDTRTVPAGFEIWRGGVRVERPAYEVDILVCDGGIITVQR